MLILISTVTNAQQAPATSTTTIVPRLVNFSGKATDSQGKPTTGIAGITFSIYKDEYEVAPLWMETQNVTADANGNYAVQLGAMSAEGLPLDLFTSGEARWLGVRLDNGEEQPRVLLLSVLMLEGGGCRDSRGAVGIRPSRHDEHLQQRCDARRKRRSLNSDARVVRPLNRDFPLLAHLHRRSCSRLHRRRTGQQSIQDRRRPSRNADLLANHWHSPGCVGERASHSCGGREGSEAEGLTRISSRRGFALSWRRMWRTATLSALRRASASTPRFERGGTPCPASATIATAAECDPQANRSRTPRGTTWGSSGQGLQLHAHPVGQTHALPGISRTGVELTWRRTQCAP
jgi:hypothetical protein